jgi:hypothetical protein
MSHADTILAAAPTKTIAPQRKHELIKQTDALLAVEDCWASVRALAEVLIANPSLQLTNAHRIAGIAALRVRLSQPPDLSSLFRATPTGDVA